MAVGSMMVVALSLPLLLLYGLAISAVLMWLKRHGVGAVASAGVTLAVCIAVAVVQGFALGPGIPTMQSVRLWVVFVCLPAAAVFAVSQLGFLSTRPWLLLVVGPIAFLIALVFVMTLHNILFDQSLVAVAHPLNSASGEKQTACMRRSMSSPAPPRTSGDHSTPANPLFPTAVMYSSKA